MPVQSERTAPHWGAAEMTAAEITRQWAAKEPGGVVVGFDRGGVRFGSAGGLADLNHQTSFSKESVGRFASNTKHILCAMVLMHPDQIDLDDPLGQHLAELQPPLSDVTVGQALDMTGGLPDMRECLTLLGLSVHSETGKGSNFDFMARQTRLNFPAGSEISYSNTGYRLVEMVLERHGLSLRSFIDEQINEPFSLAFDAPEIWAEPVANLTPGYWHDGSQWLSTHAGLQISASGSLTASADDLARWLIALLRGDGALHGLLDRLAAPRFLADGRATGYGLGLRHVALGGHDLIGHGGSHPGYSSHFLLDRASGCGVVILSNRDDTDSYGAAFGVMASLLGEDLPRRAPDSLTDGLYVTEHGFHWIEVAGDQLTWLDDCVTLYEDGDGFVSSRSATTPVRMKQDGEAIVGQVGHAERRFLLAREEPVPAGMSGRWQSPEGAYLSLEDGAVTLGIGPLQQVMPLTALGSDRYLFTLKDSLWTKRICLHRLEDETMELVLSRARMIRYHRLR